MDSWAKKMTVIIIILIIKKQLWDSNHQPSLVKILAFLGAKQATYAATGSTSMGTYC